MYDRTYFLNLLASILRFALAGVGTLFVTKGIGTQGQWDFLVAGIALFLINTVSILYGRYKSRLHFLAAVNSAPGIDVEVIKAQAAERAVSVRAAAAQDANPRP